MKRLIQRGLMFGNLIAVNSPTLVARYNAALQALTGKETKLEDFHIDMSGYSPEIGDEFGDHLYLNQGGCNRQFILLTTEQKRAPLLNVQFSTSRGILRQFIEKNETQLFALTAQDAVGGELENSVFDVTDPKRLLDIRRITVSADTTQSHVANAGMLAEKIAQFKSDPEGWWDDVLIAEMIGLAKQTGDVTRNPITLKSTEFRQENFWTKHFGGVYIFRELEHPAAIVSGDKQAVDGLGMRRVFDLGQRNQVARFLQLNDLVEPVVEASAIDGAAILAQKMDFISVDVASEMGADLEGVTRRDMRNLTRKYATLLPEEYEGLAALTRWSEGDGPWPKIDSRHPAYFYTLRARVGPDQDLVNMLLAELSAKDVRQLFICHKDEFYRRYATWTDQKKTYVADFLASEYLVDKAGARASLFGGEATMAEPETVKEDIIARVGPWGAVRRRR
jgi:hypothetical protein